MDTDSGAEMEFAEIDGARRQAGISQYALCQAAEVHPTTYQRLLKRPEGGQRRTIARLKEALARLITGPAAPGEAGHE